MELKTLFDASHEKIRVNTALLLPVERSSGEPLLREMNLASNEELSALLYIGSANSTLHVYRILTRLDQDAVRYDVYSSLLHSKRFNSTMDGNIGFGNSAMTQGVTFLHVDSELSVPLLLVLVGGVIISLHYGFLNNVDIFRHLPIPQGPIITCCVAQAQGNIPRQDRQHRLALLINRWLILVEYTEGTSQIIGSGNSGTGESTSIECPHMIVPEGTKTMAWQGDIIITGSLHEYCMFNATTQQFQQRMERGDSLSQDPLCRSVIGFGDTSYILIRIGDNQLALVDLSGAADLESAIPIGMSESILDVAFVSPFIVGVKPDGSVLMQSWLDGEEFSCNGGFAYGFDGTPHHVYSTPLGIYGICTYSVQLLVLLPKKNLVALYINAGHYERALLYVEYAYETSDELLRDVYNACARHALNEKKYNEAFCYFELAATPTVELLEFLPELCRPLKRGNQWEAKVEPTLSSSEAYRQLYELLLRRRSLGLGTKSVELQAIEFALFLFYVLEFVSYTVDELTDLFLTSSTLDPEECLYYVGDDGVRPKPVIYPLVLSCNGQFEEALERCQKRRLVYESAAVLRMSGDDELYTRFLPWMLSVNPRAALTALVWRTHHQEQQQQQQQQPSASIIIPMLLGYGGYVLHEYLHHLIYVGDNTDSKLHTLYATTLINSIQVLQSFGVKGLSAGAVKVPAGCESGIRGSTRRYLLTFLQFSHYYDTDTVLAHLLDADLIEEQVLLLKQTGDHLGALTKLVYELDDINAAVRYCEEQHSHDLQKTDNGTEWFAGEKNTNVCESQRTSNNRMEELSVKRDVKTFLTGHNYTSSEGRTFNEYFNILLHVLLVPPAGKEQLLSAALTVLNEHSYCINPLSVMTSLPDEVCVAELSSYLLQAFQTLCNNIQIAEVNANATKSMVADAQRHRDLLHQRCVYVDEKRTCAVCSKPLGLGVIAIFPNLKPTHFRCFHTPQLDPERGVPFRKDFL